MSVFAKAAEKKAAKKAAAPKAKKKQTVWSVGSPEEDAVAKSIHFLAEQNAQLKAIVAKMGSSRNGTSTVSRMRARLR
jgi:hypothetical protein